MYSVTCTCNNEICFCCVILRVIQTINWAASSEFVSSSIPSWQLLTAHAQPFRGARDLAFCLKVPLDSMLVWASSIAVVTIPFFFTSIHVGLQTNIRSDECEFHIDGRTKPTASVVWTIIGRQVHVCYPVMYSISMGLVVQRNSNVNISKTDSVTILLRLPSAFFHVVVSISSRVVSSSS